MKWIFAIFVLAATNSTFARDFKCIIHFEYGKWTDRINQFHQKPDLGLDLSNKINFRYEQGEKDGSSKPHQGEAPEEIQDLTVFVIPSVDKDTGWPGHEIMTITSRFVRTKDKKTVAGPFEVSVHYNPQNLPKNHDDRQIAPHFQGTFEWKGEPLTFKIGCLDFAK